MNRTFRVLQPFRGVCKVRPSAVCVRVCGGWCVVCYACMFSQCWRDTAGGALASITCKLRPSLLGRICENVYLWVAYWPAYIDCGISLTVGFCNALQRHARNDLVVSWGCPTGICVYVVGSFQAKQCQTSLELCVGHGQGHDGEQRWQQPAPVHPFLLQWPLMLRTGAAALLCCCSARPQHDAQGRRP